MRIADATVPVVVVTGSSDSLLHGVIGIARSLGRLGVPLHVVQSAHGTPVERSRYVERTYTVPFDLTRAREYLDGLLEIGRDLGRRPVLLPADDVAALFVAEHGDALRASFLFPNQPPGLAHALANKRELYLLCRRLGVPAPQTEFPRSRDDVADFADRTGFPVVMKAMDPVLLRLRPRARSVVIVQHRDELFEAYAHMEVDGTPNLMLQEYLPGGADSIWMFNGYFDEHSNCLVSFTGTKLRQYPPYTGATCLGVCRHNPAIEETTKDLLKSIGYHGIVDMGYRYDAHSGEYKLLDVNPRIGASFRLFVARNGMDVARAMYLDLTGQPVPEAPASEGRKWLVEQFDTLASYTYHRNHELSIAAWARSFGGVREAAWFAGDDLKPFATMTRRLLVGGFRRVSRQTLDAVQGGESANGGGRIAAQQLVDARFDAEASYWRDIYQGEDVQSAIYRHRLALALEWIDRLRLVPGSQVLEVGSGAGLLSVLLARRGLQVSAVDTAGAMLRLTVEHAASAGAASQVLATFADAHRLPYRAGTFGLVVALGVLPWLHSPQLAMQGMAEVLRPGGYLLISIDNRRRLTDLLDPRLSPPLQSLRTATKEVLGAAGIWRRTDQLTEPVAQRTMHDPDELEEMVVAAGLRSVKRSTFGFGPFTLFGHQLPHGTPAPQVNRLLQQLADRRLPGLRSSGAQCLLIAEKPAT